MSNYYAIILTGSFGDIINGTPIAAHLKKKSSDNIVHWYASSYYKTAIYNNPDIDEVFVIPAKSKPESTLPATYKAIDLAKAKNLYGKNIIVPAPYFGKYWNKQKFKITDCIRKSAEDVIGVDWAVPWIPVIKLTPLEISNVKKWVSRLPKKPKVMFEWEAQSSQSHLTPSWIAPICKQFPNWTVILSGRKPKFKLPPNAVDGSSLTIRESVELFNHVDFFVGVSSGISCACGSNWTAGKKIPWVESCNNPLWSGEIYPRENKQVCYSKKLADFVALIREKKNAA